MGSEPAPASGLRDLRRPGAIADLLFLEACARLEPSQLRPIADTLGLTVQAVSHAFRSLRRRGWVAFRDGRYRLTLEGVAWLHETLAQLADDLRARIDRLHVIRSTRALASGELEVGDAVSLEIRHGLLTARRASGGASRGTVRRAARSGELVEVEGLEGIVPITPAPIRVRTIPEAALDAPGTLRAAGRALRSLDGPLAVEGLEAYVLVRRAAGEPLQRFAPTAVCREASRLGVPSTLVVMERDLPRVLGELAGPSPPRVEVLPLGGARARATGQRGHRPGGGQGPAQRRR